MNAAAPPPPLTLLDALGDIRRARLYIAAGAALGFLLASGFLISATPSYRAHIILEPNNPMGGAEVSSVLANDDDLSSLRYLIDQVNVPSSADFARFETTLAGPAVAGALLKDDIIRAGLRDSFRKPQELAEYIRKRVRLEPVGQTAQRRMVYFHENPEFAVYFLNALHKTADERLRVNIKADTERRIDYLNAALATSPNPDHKRSITNLLMEQERLLMLSTIDQPYAASVIEPASASARPAWPDRVLVYAASIAAGAMAGFVFHGIRHGRRDR